MLMHHGIPDFREWRMRAALNPDCALRRGQSLRTGSSLLLDVGYNFMGCMLTAMNHEPAGTLRDKVTQEDNDAAKYCANAEGQPPTPGDGNNSGFEQAGGRAGTNGSTDPEGAVNNKVYVSAHPRRNQFIDG